MAVESELRERATDVSRIMGIWSDGQMVLACGGLGKVTTILRVMEVPQDTSLETPFGACHLLTFFFLALG